VLDSESSLLFPSNPLAHRDRYGELHTFSRDCSGRGGFEQNYLNTSQFGTLNIQ
jgi:hypothetical protein